MSISLRDATRSQLRLLTRSRRPLFLLTLYTGVWVLFDIVLSVNHVEVSWLPQMAGSSTFGGISAAVAIAWSVMVWRDEAPRARGYHWSLPVDTSVHDIARMLAGGVWLIVGIMWYIVFAILVGATHGVAGATATAFVPLNVLMMYSASFIAYVAGIAIVTTFEHPGEWLIGGFLFTGIAAANAQAVDSRVRSLFVGRYGLADILYHGPSPYMPDELAVTQTHTFAAATFLWAVIAFGLLALALLRNRGRRTS